MRDEMLAYLRCPHCGRGGLTSDDGVVRCPAGHSFDVARQGYVSLLGPHPPPGPGDTAAMVEARERFLAAGHYGALAEAVASACAPSAGEGGCIVDLAAGTGYYLRTVVERSVQRPGIALDLSKAAVRRAARAHPRIGAVVCDVWRPLPVRTGVATAVLSIFGPRNAAELSRILHPRGVCVVVTPTARHLAEVVDPLGLLRVDPGKRERLRTQLAPHLRAHDHHRVELALRLPHHTVEDLVAMGPSAWHHDRRTVAHRLASLDEPVAVTASFTVSVYGPQAAERRRAP